MPWSFPYDIAEPIGLMLCQWTLLTHSTSVPAVIGPVTSAFREAICWSHSPYVKESPVSALLIWRIRDAILLFLSPPWLNFKYLSTIVSATYGSFNLEIVYFISIALLCWLPSFFSVPVQFPILLLAPSACNNAVSWLNSLSCEFVLYSDKFPTCKLFPLICCFLSLSALLLCSILFFFNFGITIIDKQPLSNS